jgi:hypothetical protein
VPLSERDAADVVMHLLRLHEAEQQRLDPIHSYMRGRAHRIYVPRSATQEYRDLVAQSRVNILPLVVGAVAQNLFTEGYRPARQSRNAAVWEIWQANRMDARQAGLYRAALTYGVSYATVLPGSPRPVIRPYSPRRLTAVYEDPINDEWPVYAMTVTQELGRDKKPAKRLRLLDDTTVYEYAGLADGEAPQFLGSSTHGLDVCPVPRWLNEYGDIDDGPQGEVEQLIPLQDQLNQTTFGLLMAQQYAAFRQRWATGMAIAVDDRGVAIEPFNAAVNRLWQAESPDTRFGEFGQTDLGGYLGSRDATLRLVSSIAQIPPHVLASSGAVANLSADALAAIEAGLQRKVAERKTSFGESNEQLLRLCGLAAGDRAAWEDSSSQVVWRDTESRSLAQVADALGKMAQMLGVPPQALWERIPGVTDQDLERWQTLAEERDAIAALDRLVNGPQEGRRRAEPARAPADSGAPG